MKPKCAGPNASIAKNPERLSDFPLPNLCSQVPELLDPCLGDCLYISCSAIRLEWVLFTLGKACF